MAEDDDDEAFGDFSFAPFQSNSLFTAPNSSPAPAAEDEDDEWGDFVEPPSQSKPSGTAVNGDHRSDVSASPASWMKPRGALPLSLFGDAEEEAVAGDLAVPLDLNRQKSNGISEGGVSLGFAGNGVLKTKSFSIADLYDRYSQTKHESRDLVVKDDSVVNGLYPSANQSTAESAVPKIKNVELSNDSAVPEMKNVELSNDLVLSDHNQVANKSDDVEFSFNSYMSDPSKEEDFFGGWNGELNGFGSNLKTSPEKENANVVKLNLDLDMNGDKQQLDGSITAINDDDDEEWDFKDADSEFLAQDVNNNVGFMAPEASESSPYLSGTGIDSTKSLDLFGTPNGSSDFFASSNEPVDFFANPSSISTTSQEVDLIGDHGIEELDDDFGDFSDASSKTGPKPKELFINGIHSPVKDAVQIPDEKIQEKDTNLNHHRGAIPLSIFGDEEPENGSSSDVQDIFSHQSIPAKKSDHIASTVDSISDMISNLYSQAEQTSSIKTEHNLSGSQLNLPSVVSSSDLVDNDDNDDDDDDGGSWDFKDASEIGFDSQASLTSGEDAYMSKSSKLKLDSYLAFYLKLKEELCFIGKNHIDGLKNAEGDAVLSVEGARAESFDSEFQFLCIELAENGAFQDHNTRDSHLHEFAEVLLEPQFQRLESEYHLSQKLLIVEKDLGSYMGLLRHTNAMLKILNIGTQEEQKVYLSLWSEMISVCSQELRHGASIWNDALMKHVHSQFLSEPQGRNFVLALGEVYRVVVVLGASAKLFKPWILSNSVDSPSIYILLEECHAVWSTSRLEEALASVSAPTTLSETSLFKSIRHIVGLDVPELENYVFAEKESRCWLSLLTAGVVPDLKIVTWGNEQCFVTLANLCANMISRYPPNLPQLILG
ncbi:uncharacterized protein LOC121804510 isoform X1 [Salvia splendens]|uniref:uncharacterized protein LOC121804510 isoform X1 n=1 Tax=Salvia splendens TaxID=180675 RepID=UPI001C26F71D|nr:uncharacterized protein LOC121804510 isoform X1 [Salvia splendens]